MNREQFVKRLYQPARNVLQKHTRLLATEHAVRSGITSDVAESRANLMLDATIDELSNTLYDIIEAVADAAVEKRIQVIVDAPDVGPGVVQ